MVLGSSFKQGWQEWDALNKKNGWKKNLRFSAPFAKIPILAKHHGFRFHVFGSLRVAAARWFGAHPGYIRSPTIIREWGKAGTERFFQVSKHPRLGGCFFQIKKMMFSTSSNFTIPAQVYYIYDSNSIYILLFFATQCLVYLPLSTYKTVLLRGGICR